MGCTSSSPTDIAEAPKVHTHSPKHNTEPSENSLNHFPEASTLTQCSSSSTVTSSILPSSSSSNEHLFCQPNAAATAAPATPSSRTNISTFAQESQQQQRDKQHDKKESSSNAQVAPSSSVVTRPEPPIPLRRAKSETGEHRRRLVKNKLSSSYRRLLECKFPTPAAAHAALGEEYVAWLRHLEALSNEYLSMPPCSSDDLSEVSVSMHSQQSNPPVLPSNSPDAGTRSARSVTVVSKSRFDCAVDPGLNVLHIQQHVASYLGILKLPPSTLVSSPPAILSTPASTQYSDRALSTDSLPSDLPPASDLCLPEAAISASIDVLQVDVPRSGDLEDDDDDDYEEDMRYDGREQKRNNNVEASPMYFAEHTPELPRFGGAYYT